MKYLFLSLVVAILFVYEGDAQVDTIAFRNYNLPVEARVKDLVSRMTLKEKCDQLLYTAPAIPHLGIPEYNWWNEALHGVARAGYATVFPQPITLAASWNEDLVYRVANIISDEARAKYHEFARNGKRGIYQGLTFWSPNINIFRDPRWGRGHETYGEDPFLTGRLGLQFVKGLQGSNPDYLKSVATAKHYAVHSGPEPTRHSFNAIISERDLRETYLPAFRTLVVEGRVASVMSAYNMFRGHPCCANEELYSILRDEWGFSGYIVSDCWAVSDFYTFQGYTSDGVEAAALAVKKGTDLECGVEYKHLEEAISKELITEKDIDIAVMRVMEARFRLGLFDPDYLVPYASIPYTVNCSDYNRTIARDAARESMVLLKNKNNILPLKRDVGRIAVIGPNGDNFEALTGNYNGIPKVYQTVLDGIRKLTEPFSDVVWSEGSDLADGIHNLMPVPGSYLRTSDGKQGATGRYYSSREMSGIPVFERTDDNINFYWENGSPGKEMPDDDFGIHWTTFLMPDESGEYYLGGWGSSEYEILLDGEPFLKSRSEHHAFHKEKPIVLEKGKSYRIDVKYRNWSGDADIKLLWAKPRDDIKQRAISVAESADVVVLVLGLSQRLEGEEMEIKIEGFEGGDRTNLNLPALQEELFTSVIETGKPVIVVLMNGGALSVNKIAEKADAILAAGYPGQEGGLAVADVIFGEYNPAGRLPATWYKSVDDLPSFDNYDMKGRTYRYLESVPLYPFGYGLSFTSFVYSNLQIPEKVEMGSDVKISVTVKNSGKYDGDEVVQLYLTDEKASTVRPRWQLEGFKRIHLKAGESRIVEFKLSPYQFSLIDNSGNRAVEPGYFTIYVGGGQPLSPGIPDAGSDPLKGRLRMTGKTLLINNK